MHRPRESHCAEKIARRRAGLQSTTGFAAARVIPVATAQALVLGWLLNLPTDALAAANADSQVIPNRTLPTVAPPPKGLEFSDSPTVEELFRARVFAEPLVPVGGEPTAEENSDLAAALLGYAKRTGPDDFASLTGFLQSHPNSPWTVALLTDMGIEYYNTAHYSLALDAWSKAWELGQNATEPNAKAIADRAVGELAGTGGAAGACGRIGGLVQVRRRTRFHGPATDRIYRARGGLREMKERPEFPSAAAHWRWNASSCHSIRTRPPKQSRSSANQPRPNAVFRSRRLRNSRKRWG